MFKNITIPTDEDGFVLLQCHICGEYFKLLASEINDDSTINIWCPYCGLNGKQYAPKEVLENAIKIAENEFNEIVHNAFKKMEKETKNSPLKFKSTGKPNLKDIPPIKVKIDKLELQNYKCCNSMAKIQPISKMCGRYCPICGGINYE